MRYTAIATRVSDGARIIVPFRRHLRGGTNNTAKFTAQANARAEDARKARGA